MWMLNFIESAVLKKKKAPFTRAKRLSTNLFQHNNASMQNVRFIKTWFVKVGDKELERPAESHELSLTEHLWNEFGVMTTFSAF